MEPKVVTEKDLQKSLDELAGKEPQKTEEKAPEAPKVEVTYLGKTVKEKVESNEKLAKALEVSEVLKDFSDEVTGHIDESLTALQGGLKAAAERDNTVVEVLSKMAKSIAELSEEIKKVAAQPAAAPKSVTVTSKEVLQKSSESEEKPKEISKRDLINSLLDLSKSAKDPQDAMRFGRAISMYESTGKMSDENLAAAKENLKKGK